MPRFSINKSNAEEELQRIINDPDIIGVSSKGRTGNGKSGYSFHNFESGGTNTEITVCLQNCEVVIRKSQYENKRRPYYASVTVKSDYEKLYFSALKYLILNSIIKNDIPCVMSTEVNFQFPENDAAFTVNIESVEDESSNEKWFSVFQEIDNDGNCVSQSSLAAQEKLALLRRPVRANLYITYSCMSTNKKSINITGNVMMMEYLTPEIYSQYIINSLKDARIAELMPNH